MNEQKSWASTGAGVAKTVLPGVVKVLIADSDRRFMDTLRNHLHGQPGCEVVGCVETIKDAFVWCEELSPNILILDWHLLFEGLMPSANSDSEFLRRIKKLPEPPAVIVASRYNQDEHRFTAKSAGADEFMPKSQFPQMLRQMITRLTPQF
jgi:DNA-binding NarL/FixJ family response regulator